MRILLDGRDDVFVVDGPTKLEELLEELEDLCVTSGRQVKRVSVDGKELALEELKAMRDKDLGEFETIEIETVGHEETALEELVNADNFLLEAEAVVRRFLDSGSLDYQDVVLSVVGAMNNWEKACRIIDDSARALDVDYTKLQWDSIDFKQQHARSMEIIQSLSKAMSTRDIVSMRDLLEYEFLPQIQTYRSLIKKIISTLAERRG